jgi:hypothetical protein
MRVHRVRKLLGSKRGEVALVGQQAVNEARKKGALKPLGSALLHSLLVKPKTPPGDLCKGGKS